LNAQENPGKLQPAKLNWDRCALFQAARRVVVKAGSGVVCNSSHEFDRQHILPLVRDVAELVLGGRQVVLVSSGAVTLGAAALNLHRSRLRDASVTRACAAVGQCRLVEAYAEFFRPHGLKVAQVLVTEDDFTNHHRYRNLRQTFEKLLKLGAIPIVNENDTVSDFSSQAPAVFRDNDRLAALLLSKLDADALVLLSNVDGLLDRLPSDAWQSQVISLVTEITPEIRGSASGVSATGRGGMASKLQAAEIAMLAGGLTVIANGKTAGILGEIFAGKPLGTLFLPRSRMAGKRRWLAFASTVRGRVTINANACTALQSRHASLLLSGVTSVDGTFAAGEVVFVLDSGGQIVGRGIAEFDSGRLAALLEHSRPVKGTLIRRERFLLHLPQQESALRQPSEPAQPEA